MVERTLDDYVEGNGSPGNGIGQWKIEYCGICATGKAINTCVKCGNRVCPEHFVSIMGLCVGCAPVKNVRERPAGTEDQDRTISEGLPDPPEIAKDIGQNRKEKISKGDHRNGNGKKPKNKGKTEGTNGLCICPEEEVIQDLENYHKKRMEKKKRPSDDVPEKDVIIDWV